MLISSFPSLVPATPDQLAYLAATGFYFPARAEGLPADLVALRAGFYFLPEDMDDDLAFDAWMDYTDSIGMDFDTAEAIDMALCFA